MADGRRVFGYNYGENYGTNKMIEYRRFSSEYFSGADIRIYFGDIWVDEITSLQFTLQEQVAPIFGYASYTWDKVARGNRYIQGSFSINFKESYYLQQALKSLTSEMKSDASGNTSGFNSTTWKNGLDVEALMMQVNKQNFNSIADEFEKTLWDSSDATTNVNNNTKRREQNSYFYPEFITGRDTNGNTTYDDTSQKQLMDYGFNILISYGPMNEVNGMTASETLHSLVGVQLTGVSQIIGGDGSPVQEQYTFIAKDLDGNVQVKY
jgi:hypothetical protein